MGIGIGRIRAAAWLAAPLLCSVSTSALAQALNFTTFAYPGSAVTTVTGIRGNNMTGELHDRQQRRHRRRALHPAVAHAGALSQRLVAARQLHRRHHQHALRAELRLGDRHPAQHRQLQDGGQRHRRPRLSLSTAPTRPASSSRRWWRGAGSPTPSTPSPTRPSATRWSATSTPAARPATPSSTTSRRHLHHHQPPGRRQHDGLRRLRQPHRRRLGLGPGLSRAYILNQDTGVYTDLRRAWRRHRGHALRGHHRRRPRQHLQPGGRFGRRQRRRHAWVGPCRRDGASRPGPSSPSAAPGLGLRDLGQFDLRQHRDRRLRPERRHQRLHHQRAGHLQSDHQQRRASPSHGRHRRHRLERRRHRQQRVDPGDRRRQRRHQQRHLRRRHQQRHDRRQRQRRRRRAAHRQLRHAVELRHDQRADQRACHPDRLDAPPARWCSIPA